MRLVPKMWSLFPALAVAPAIGVLGHPDHEKLRHWEIASPDPDRIVLTWMSDPATSQAVTWRTDLSVTEGFAEIAPARPDARFDLEAQRMPAVTEKLALSDSEQEAVHYHSAQFESLEPDTLYAYRVGDGEERWSEWIQFRTAKAEAAPFTFLYFGDAQNAVLSHWSRVIRAAYAQAPHAAFSIHAGDLINRAHKDREWAEWFTAGGWIHASVPSIPVAGNHEYGSSTTEDGKQERRLSEQWRPQFTLPVVEALPPTLAETAYVVDYQGVRIVALNSNQEIETQARWLDAALSEKESRWTVVTLHHPIFSSGKGRENASNRAALKPIIDKHKVDLVLQGHDHTYARGHTPVRVATEASQAITSLYVNSVSGPKMYEFQKNGWKVYEPEGVVLDRKAENTPFFQVIDVDDETITYRAFMADGRLYDAVRLRKTPDGAKELLKWEGDLGEERRFENTKKHTMDGL